MTHRNGPESVESEGVSSTATNQHSEGFGDFRDGTPVNMSLKAETHAVTRRHLSIKLLMYHREYE